MKNKRFMVYVTDPEDVFIIEGIDVTEDTGFSPDEINVCGRL